MTKITLTNPDRSIEITLITLYHLYHPHIFLRYESLRTVAVSMARVFPALLSIGLVQVFVLLVIT
jgi:hypothetical protein